MIALRTLALISLFLVGGVDALAFQGFDTCGRVKAWIEFKVDPKKGRLLLLIDRRSENQVTVDVGSYDGKDPRHLDGTRAVVELEVLQTCRFQCTGNLLRILRKLSPFESITGLECVPVKALAPSACADPLPGPLRTPRLEVDLSHPSSPELPPCGRRALRE